MTDDTKPDAPGPDPSGTHLDDDVLALLVAETAGARELAYVRAHLGQCPACRRLVSAVLAEGQASADPARGTLLEARAVSRIRTAPLTLRGSIGSRFAWPRLAAAAVLLVAAGLLYSRSGDWTARRPSAAPFESLASNLEVRSAARMAAGEAPRSTGRGTPDGVVEARPGDTLQVVIDPPRDGLAVVVRVGPDGWEVLKGELPVTANARREGDDDATNVYSPIPAPGRESVLVVVVADASGGSVRETVASTISPSEKVIGDLAAWKPRVLDALRKAGHRWASIREVPTRPMPPPVKR